MFMLFRSRCDRIVQPAMNNALKLSAVVGLGVVAMNLAAIAATPKTPTFFARHDYPGLNGYYVQAVDTNGDKIPDLISNHFGYISVLLGNGDGTFRSGPVTNTGAGGADAFTPIDLNGDGIIDLVLSNGSGVAVSMGNGDGTFRPAVSYPINDASIENLVVGDFNGDGIVDIATVGINSGVWILTGKGGGAFNPAVLAVSLQGSDTISVGDLNEDSKLDLVVTLPFVGNSGGGFAVLIGNGNGTFQNPIAFSTPTRPLTATIGSLTKGGPPSIVVDQTGSSYVYLYFGNGKGGVLRS
jgi:hypothetical protein